MNRRRAVALFALSVAGVSLAGCGDGDLLYGCENKELARRTSPDGRFDAVVFERGCGATTGNSRQLSLVRTGRAPKGKGNILIAGDSAQPTMVWRTPAELEVSHAAAIHTFRKETSYGGVKISYRTDCDPEF